MEISNQIIDLIKSGNKKIQVAYSDGTKEVLRLFLSKDGDICQYQKGSSKRGYLMSTFDNIVSVSNLSPKKSKEKQWVEAWDKVDARLEKSGLWKEIREEIKLVREVGYSKLMEANSIGSKFSSQENADISSFKEHFPLLVKTDEQGKDYVNYTILWGYSHLPRVKKMRFAKGSFNDQILQGIQVAMDQHKSHSAHYRLAYDVSIEYNAEKQKAWYSEEFQNCGNGHYYLALDSTHALFMEDD